MSEITSFIRLDLIVEIEDEDKMEVLEKVRQFLKENGTELKMYSPIQEAKSLDYWMGF